MANKIVRINHAGHASGLRATTAAGGGFVGAYYASLALHRDVFLSPGDFRRQYNLELRVGAHFQRRIRSNVNSGGAQVSGYSASLSRLVRLMNLDRQFEGKPFSRPRFGHKSS